MMECRHCRELIRGDLEAFGSRCPRCRMPLYERPQLPRRLSAGESAKACLLHPGIQSVASCQRCGSPMCFTCRTRWYDQAVCVACVERALSSKEPPPEDAAAHRRQAVLSIVCGLAGWLLFALGGVMLLTLHGGRSGSGLTLMGPLIVLASFMPALFAVGQATAAIRTRGERMKLATSGLACAGTHLGVMLGFLLLNIWHN